MTLSLSEDELTHIGSAPEKPKDYMRLVMDQYAQHFKLKGGQLLRRADLVWGAIIRKHHTHWGADLAVGAGQARVGDQRAGLQSHVHIIGSARNCQQKNITQSGRTQVVL